MNAQEALNVIRIVRAACPAQKFDEYTIDVWADALRDVDFGQARDAVRRLVQAQPWIAVSEIVGEVKRNRSDAARRLADRATFRAIESAAARDLESSHAAYLETRRAFDEALTAKHPETEGAEA